MALFSNLSFVLILIISTFNAESGCNFATFSGEVIGEFDLGTFSLTTNKCQSFKSLIHYDFFGLSGNALFDGSLLIECATESKLRITLYDGPICSESNKVGDSIEVDQDSKSFDIFGGSVEFNLDSMSCDNKDCFVEMEIAKNCSWLDSESYIDLNVPPLKCISLAPDFKGVLSSIPYEFLPEEFVETLDSLSINFTCCSEDNSLLIYNYTDTQCNNLDSYIRINSEFNGQCFVLGERQNIYNKDINNKAKAEDANNDDTYVYVLKWECNSYQICDNIQFLDDSMFPNQCLDECSNPNSDTNANANGSSRSGLNENTKDILIICGVVIGCLAIFIGIIASLFLYQRKKKIKKQMENEMNIGINNINKKDKDSKYEQMITEDEQDYVPQIDPDDEINGMSGISSILPIPTLDHDINV